jgi:transposase
LLRTRGATDARLSSRRSTLLAGVRLRSRGAAPSAPAARDGAVNARRAGLCQLRDLIVTAPEPLRSELRPLTRSRLLKRLRAVRPSRHVDVELRGTLRALRSLARRIEQLTAEERELETEIATLTRELAPQLLDEPGVGSLAAAQLLLSWSHPGRVRSEAAFARLAGCAPIPASSGQTIRYRLDRSGDSQLNRALHMILVSRRRWHQPNIDYIARRRQDGKTTREANRCLKRYLARNLYRLLEHGPPMTA